MKNTIFLIRHAEPVRIDQQKRYVGQQDMDVSPFGRHQAEELSNIFRHCPVQSVFTSDLLRAVSTATCIARGHCSHPEIIKEFREINLGSWDGKTFQEVQNKFKEEYTQRGLDIVNYRTPGGESFADLQARVIPAFTRVADKMLGSIVIVAHAGVNRVILCHLMQKSLEELLSIPQDYAAVNIIEKNAEIFHVVATNVTADGLVPYIR